MRRITIILAGFFLAMLALTDDAAAAAAAAATAAGETWTGSTIAWATGLLSGLALAIAVRINWRTMPMRLIGWARQQRHRAGLAMLGSLFLAVIVFY